MAVRIEDVKAAGIAVDIDRLAASGFESISDDDKYRLKTQGVCSQRDVGVFMLRIRVAGGKASAAQLRRAAELAQRYTPTGLHVTTRGGLEIHHAKIEDVPAIQAGLEDCGLTTKGTCGDTIRNVIACAHSGTYAGEVLPLDAFAQLIHDHVVAISDATNISRKMNVAMACSPHCDDHVATSDIGFVATPDPAGGAPTFTVWGAGGLGATPRLAIELRRGLAQAEVLVAFDALVAMGAKYGDRSARAKAKIKLLVDSWGAERVRAVFDEEFALAKAQPHAAAPLVAAATTTHDSPPAAKAGTVIAQKQPDRFIVPALVPMGELTNAAAFVLADAAERFANGFVFLTTDQNAELHDVSGANVAGAIAAIESADLRTGGRGGISDVVSCVGLEYCPLAVTHSMTMGEEIALAFASLRDDPRYADFRIHVSGCPHSCAKHQVADIGLAGAMTDYEGKKVEAFAFNIGGNARERRLGAVYPKKIPRPKALAVIKGLLAEYEEHALPDERFSETLARVGSDVFFHAIGAVLDGTAMPHPAVRSGKLVVIGNGMAGAKFVEELRARASESFDVTVLGDEPHGGYNRIMLSGVLGGFRTPDEIITHAPAWYADRRIALHRGTAAAAIDRDAKIVTTATGERIAYDALVIATGSRALVPPIPGLDARHVYVMRTIDDCARIQAAVTPGMPVVVLGGGLLGLEAASGLRALGAVPTVVHMAPTLMEMQLDADGGRALGAKIEALGITLKTSARAVKAYDDEGGRGIELADGTRVPGDAIVVCCGILPNVALARDAGLAVERGITVDDGMQTNDPAVFAIGECVQHRGVMYGLVEPLWEQCAVLADRLTGRRSAYPGSKVGTKLKVAGVNVIALGEREPLPGDESIAVIDASGAYKRGIVRNGMLVGAQVVGDAAAAAALGKAFDRGSPLAGSLAALLFGNDGIGGSAALATGGDELVCICNEVPQSVIEKAIAAGAHDVAELGRITLAGTGCGTCRGQLAAMVISAKTASAG
jgi:NAD(P)H-nitrite reductase large subunit